MYGRKHHIVEMRGGVTDAGQPIEQLITEDRATQQMEAGRLSFTIPIENTSQPDFLLFVFDLKILQI